MAIFPSLEPTAPSYDLRSFPVTAATFANGDQTRFRWGTTATSAPVVYEFEAISVASAELIRNHYLGQRDSQPFLVPVHLWRLHVDQYQIIPADQYYVYTAPPDETPIGGGLVTVSISLRASL